MYDKRETESWMESVHHWTVDVCCVSAQVYQELVRSKYRVNMRLRI
jgi:hypothetical protein